MASINGIRIALYVVLVCSACFGPDSHSHSPRTRAVALLRCPARPDGHAPALHPLPPAVRPAQQRPGVLRPHRRRAPRHLRPRPLLVLVHVRLRPLVPRPMPCPSHAHLVRRIHIIHRSYDYGRLSSFAGELFGLFVLFVMFLVGAAIATVRTLSLLRPPFFPPFTSPLFITPPLASLAVSECNKMQRRTRC